MLNEFLKNYSFTSIFRVIACVGDSLSSGEFQIENKESTDGFTYHDKFEYSWGQFLARKIGSKVYNFSRGGMTAQEYCETFAEQMDYYNPDYKAQAYIIALGVNDLLGRKTEFGSIKDIDFINADNKKTFIGYYAKIIQNYKKINPKAKFFLITMPRESDDTADKISIKIDHAEFINELATKFDNTYVLDLHKFAPVYDEDFKKKYYLNGHMNPCGYIFTAALIDELINNVIENNITNFYYVGMDDFVK